MSDVSLKVRDRELHVEGALTRSTAVDVLESGRSAISRLAGGGAAVLDLGDVSASDSCGLAVLVDWLRTARSCDVTLTVQRVPPQLAALAGVCGLDRVLAGNGHRNDGAGG